jgi:hypothetical protein
MADFASKTAGVAAGVVEKTCGDLPLVGWITSALRNFADNTEGAKEVKKLANEIVAKLELLGIADQPDGELERELKSALKPHLEAAVPTTNSGAGAIFRDASRAAGKLAQGGNQLASLEAAWDKYIKERTLKTAEESRKVNKETLALVRESLTRSRTSSELKENLEEEIQKLKREIEKLEQEKAAAVRAKKKAEDKKRISSQRHAKEAEESQAQLEQANERYKKAAGDLAKNEKYLAGATELVSTLKASAFSATRKERAATQRADKLEESCKQLLAALATQHNEIVGLRRNQDPNSEELRWQDLESERDRWNAEWETESNNGASEDDGRASRLTALHDRASKLQEGWVKQKTCEQSRSILYDDGQRETPTLRAYRANTTLRTGQTTRSSVNRPMMTS